MNSNQPVDDGQDNFETPDFGQTSPLQLTDYDGADHRGRVKLTFDDSTIPDDLDSSVADDLDWAVRAVNAVVHHPNLVLWVRAGDSDLIIAYHPKDGHERAGYLRAATFERSDRASGPLTTDTEIGCGLLTPFDTINVLYDYLVGESYLHGYSMILADIQYLNDSYAAFDHPITSYRPGIESWGRHQLYSSSFPRPIERERTAYPEQAYRETKYPDDEHKHATSVLHGHINAFALNE